MGPMAAHRPYGRGQRGGAQEPLRRGRRSMPACGGRCAGCRSGQGGETVSVSRSVRLSPSPSPSCSCVSGSAGKGGCIVRVVLDALTGLSQDALIGLTLHRFAPWYGVAQGTPRPALPAVLPIALWPDIGAQGNTREAAAVCPGCWGERAVILLPWRLHHLTACPRHRVLLRQRCAGCAEPLRLTAGRGDCARCGAAIAAMPTRSIAGDPDCKTSKCLRRTHASGDPKRQSACAENVRVRAPIRPERQSACADPHKRGACGSGFMASPEKGHMSVKEDPLPRREGLCCGLAQAL